jgi:hypothetical protein
MALAYAACQLALLVFWPTSSSIHTVATFASLAIALAGTTVLSLLVFLDHVAETAPSMAISIFLVFRLLADATKTRTLWLMSSTVVEGGLNAGLVGCALTMLSLHEIGRLPQNMAEASPEDVNGPLNRLLFIWMNSLFRKGFSSQLDMSDAPPMPKVLHPRDLADRLRRRWHLTSSKCRCILIEFQTRLKHPGGSKSLMVITIKSYGRIFLAGILPRALLVLTTISQSLLLNRTLELFETDQTALATAQLYGLVGANALVYITYAVSTSPPERVDLR